MTDERVFDASLVIPAFRESSRLPKTIPGILDFIHQNDLNWEVRIVDDGSGDDTIEVARGFADAVDHVVAQAEPHRGKGGAVRAGMLAARAPLRVMCDADMSMPVSMVPRIIDALEAGADVAIASREAPGANRIGEPEYRHMMGRVFNGVVQVMILPGIKDTQCGFKGFRAEAADSLFRRAMVEGFAFDVEVLYLARRKGLRIEEVAIDWTHDDDSRVNAIRDTRRMLAEIARIRLHGLMGYYDGL
ncbi:MAG: glycosyltransferase family 2 protein [Myxococcota bacterium]|nr:glycosyltransferase family 2 protein [Myxococcota bacterium]